MLSSAAAAVGEHRHASSEPSTDQLTGTGAGKEPAQPSCLLAAYTREEGLEGQKQFAPGTLVQHGFSDQAVPGLQRTTAAAAPGLDHGSASDRQNESNESTMTHAVECEAAVGRVAPVWALSPRQSPGMQAVPGTAAHAEAEPASDSPETRRSGGLLVPPQPPCRDLLAGAAATDQDALCGSEARCSGVSLSDACASVEASEASGHSSPAARAAHDVHCPHAQKMSERSMPQESPSHGSLPPAPVEHTEGSGPRSHLAAQAHPLAVISQPAASEGALTRVGAAAGRGQAALLIQTAVDSPESPLSSSVHSTFQEVGEQLDAHHATTDEVIKNAPTPASPLRYEEAALMPGSTGDPGRLAHAGSSEQPGQASSSGSRHTDTVTDPQSTSTADAEPHGRRPELAHEVLSSLQPSSLTPASQELLAAMQDVRLPSAAENAGVEPPKTPRSLPTQSEPEMRCARIAAREHTMQVRQALAHRCHCWHLVCSLQSISSICFQVRISHRRATAATCHGTSVAWCISINLRIYGFFESQCYLVLSKCSFVMCMRSALLTPLRRV